MSKLTLSIVIVFIAILGVSVYSVNTDSNYGDLKKQLKASHILHKPDKKLLNFALVDHNNEIFNNDRLQGQWTLLTFIYTHCPDVCPTVLMDMASIKSNLKNSGLESIPEFVAITFDPKRSFKLSIPITFSSLSVIRKQFTLDFSIILTASIAISEPLSVIGFFVMQSSIEDSIFFLFSCWGVP